MNIPIHYASSKNSLKERFDQLCLQMIDAFRQLDFALEDWIRDAGENCANGSTGCRIKMIQKINFDENVATKAQATRLRNLSSELAETIDLRNAVIHSEPTFGQVDDIEMIFLRPVGYRHGSKSLHLHVNQQDITRAIELARATANWLNSWRRQRDEKTKDAKASSPPPPSPGGAAGP